MHRALLAALLLAPVSALAWNPFADAPSQEEVRLSPSDLSKVRVQAGWAKGDDHTLLFEVSNGLKGPIQCAGVQVDLQDGKSLGKSLMPKLFVPPASTRNASLPGVQKGTMKAYGIQCTCFKVAGKGECINPLRKSARGSPLTDVGHAQPGLLRGARFATLQQLDRDAVGRAHERHVPVARRA